MLWTISPRRQLFLDVFHEVVSWNENSRNVRAKPIVELKKHKKHIPSQSPFGNERILGLVPSDPRGIMSRRTLFVPDNAMTFCAACMILEVDLHHTLRMREM